MKTLINVISNILILTSIVLLLGSDVYLEIVPLLVALALSLVVIRMSLPSTPNEDLPQAVEFIAQADAIGYELLLEYFEEEGLDFIGDFEDGVVIGWVSRDSSSLTEIDLEGLVTMQGFLNQWS